MKNFISINGKQTELTDEQLKQLGIDVEKKCKTPFDRGKEGEKYYIVNELGDMITKVDSHNPSSDQHFKQVNYVNDFEFAKHLRLKELLNRKLLKFSYENGWCESLWKDNIIRKFFIYKSYRNKDYVVCDSFDCKCQGTVHFCTKEIAQRAIDEIILPFEKEYPEFRW